MIGCLAFLLAAQGFDCSVTLSQERISPEDHLHVEVSVTHPVGYLLDLDSLKAGLPLHNEDGLNAPFSLVEERLHLPEVEGDRVCQKLSYELEPWTAGRHNFFFMPLIFYNKEGERHEAPGQVVTVEVAKLAESTKKPSLAPLMPLVDRPQLTLNGHLREKLSPLNPNENRTAKELRRRKNLTRLILTLGGVAFALYFVRKIVRHFRNGTEIAKALQPDPITHALSSLEVLQKEQLPEKGVYDLYYVRLTSIVRTFIEDHYSIRAPELTTEEFLSAASRMPYLAQLHPFLAASDLVKFAAVTSTPQECADAHLRARRFILYQSDNQTRT